MTNEGIFVKLGITASINTTTSAVLAFKKVLEKPGKRLVDLIDAGEPLPVEVEGETIYFVGPSPAKPDQVIGSCVSSYEDSL